MEFFCLHCQAMVRLPEESPSSSCPTCGHDLVLPISSSNAFDFSTRSLGTETPESITPPAPVSASNPGWLGRYRVESEISQGGYGVVYRAYDEELRRQVAIKVPRRDRFHSDRSFESFLEEARTSARLKHRNIVTVYDVGRTEDGLRFIVMDYIDGGSLRDQLEKGRLGAEACARLVAEIANAVHHAHENGFIHRDLKPSNVLLDRAGRPFVADFGLAVPVTSPELKTTEIIGTPPYMAPEQVRGENHRIDRRTDVWAMGVIFYEMLTGRRPFLALERNLFREILTQVPDPPRRLIPSIPRSLEQICLRCLEKRMSDRFVTAAELRQALLQASPLAVHAVSAGQSGNFWDASTAGVPATGEPSSSGSGRHDSAVHIVPRGLHSFNSRDAEFFLELLPGPRGADGLPDTIAQLKQVIEARRADESFPVGWLYGPSGCGKSSYLKAGLLPRLAADITVVYVEASPTDTEARVLSALQREIPQIPGDLALAETLVTIREREYLQPDGKLLLVLDQFEQWLHAHGNYEETELLRALRHCDGTRISCLITVRSDFGLGATRFMDALELPIIQGRTFHTIDRFSLTHARHVLAEFGRAYGQLPLSSTAWTPAHRRFLDEAIQSLEEDGKIIPVRLALFADMMKDRPWVPQTLALSGGAAGIGVAFLEQNFAGESANPQVVRHAAEARRLLQRFLPDGGEVIRGHSVPVEELAVAAGYAPSSPEFFSLLRILDAELRLITPVEAEPANDEESESARRASATRYQLTHDFLVPALRTWLTGHQRSTRRGRAELNLQERAVAWTARPEGRQLPTLVEWLNIRWNLTSRAFTPSQARMMKEADRRYVRRLSATAAAIVLLLLAGRTVWQAVQTDRQRALIQAEVLRFLDAEAGQVPLLAKSLAVHREQSSQILQQRLGELPLGSTGRARTHWFLLPDDSQQAELFVEAALSADVQELEMYSRHLPRGHAALQQVLWKRLLSPAGAGEQLLPAASLAAAVSPTDERWARIAPRVVERLLQQNPLVVAEYARLLHPAREQLLPTLTQAYEARAVDGSNRPLAATLLAQFAADDIERIVQLQLGAERDCWEAFLPVVASHRQAAVSLLVAELDREPVPRWPLSRRWQPTDSPPELARQQIEQAAGCLSDEFAIVQHLPWDEFEPLSSTLSQAGYRPHCFRPFLTTRGILVAAVWWRDGLQWHFVTDQTPDQLRELSISLRQRGLIPYDLAFLGESGDSADRPVWAGLWCEPYPDVVDAQMYVAVPEAEHQSHWEPLNHRGFIPRTNLFHRDASGSAPHYSSVRWRMRTGHASGAYYDCWDSPQVTAAALEAGQRVAADIRVVGTDPEHHHVAGVWWESAELHAELLEPSPCAEQQSRWTKRIADRWRPASISVVESTDGGLVGSTVWHRREPASRDWEESARRKAQAAIALLRIDHAAPVWPLLTYQEDPRIRHWVIHLAGPLRVDGDHLWEQLKREPDPGVRQALLLMLGERIAAGWSAPAAEFAAWLAKVYREDPDAGVHAAVQYAARKRELSLPEPATTPTLKADRSAPAVRWLPGPAGHTFVEFPENIAFSLGATDPLFPADREAPIAECRIPRRFAIAVHEVTREQFLRCQPDFDDSRDYAQDPRCPAIQVTIHDALQYCNWLSEQASLPPEEWCYVTDGDGRFRCAERFLERSGFRLPTEAEWEFACRAGTKTARHFGSSPELLNFYAWTADNSQFQSWPVGSLRPSEAGLFDMLGNAMELCHGTETAPGSQPGVHLDDGARLPANVELHRQRRGGAFLYQPADATSHHRDTGSVHVSQPFLGFRVARTLKPSP